TFHKYSDIDVAVFLDQDDIDGFDEEVMMMKLRRGIDIDIEPHAFARTDFDETDPLINEIVRTGERII
ncbi:MAG TPA: nucleotidyltransferase domain-containing protein, partial [Nitrospirota bacterium]